MKKLPSEFAAIYEVIKTCIEDGDLSPESGSMQQIVAMQDTVGEITSFVNDVTDSNNETEFVAKMVMHRQIERMVCMWSSGEIDVPSRHLTEELIRANKCNINAKVLLNGRDRYVVKELRALLPQAIEQALISRK